jgi:cytochrome b pre-mRNA-processing protein 3
MGVFGFLKRRRHERTGFELYGAAVRAARQPYFYTALGVPDTLDGRFDMVGVHAFLLIRRLRTLPPPGEALAQAVFDAMFNDMDINLREMGVGDLSVGRKVRAMWEAFHGRSNAYQAALAAGDLAALEAALARNLWPAETAPVHAAALARLVAAQDAFMATQSLDDLAAGRVAFREPVVEPVS